MAQRASKQRWLKMHDSPIQINKNLTTPLNKYVYYKLNTNSEIYQAIFGVNYIGSIHDNFLSIVVFPLYMCGWYKF